MFDWLGKMVTRWWWGVILAWVVVLIFIKSVAPNWDDITNDGDLAYLPETMPSYVGETLLEEAFPQDRAKSQIVLVTARNNAPLSPQDLDIASDIARRFENYQGAAAFEKAKQLKFEAEEARKAENAEEAGRLEERADILLEDAEEALNEAISIDEQLTEHFTERMDKASPQEQKRLVAPPPLAAAYWNRARLFAYQGKEDEAKSDREQAIALDPELKDAADEPLPKNATALTLVDVWTWNDDIYGSKLEARREQKPAPPETYARLVVLQLSNEFMQTENIVVLGHVEEELGPVREYAAQMADAADTPAEDRLQIGISGSAAVGGDMLRSARDSIQHTELFTVLIVIAILLCVYRSPLLVIVPLITIGVSLQVAMGTVALLTQLNHVPGFGWWDLKVFTTTNIFIVVILFGAGTDFCLFLISRFKEELEHGHELRAANSRALSMVADALIASAMTTILGLGMMFFADFGKYTYSGPVIGLCLFVTLLACLTLAPALLRACGTWLFWPTKIAPRKETDPVTHFDFVWNKLARWIVAYPVPILVGSVLILFPAAWHGWSRGEHVTYDFLSGLSEKSPSKAGTKLLQQHFPVGESGPLVVIAERKASDWTVKENREPIRTLAAELEKVEGITGVRNVTNPLGEKRGAKRMSVLEIARQSAMANHRRSVEMYVSQAPEHAGDVTRLELTLSTDPFDIKSLEVLQRVDQRLEELIANDAYWREATFSYAGATAGVRDLRQVTRADNQRIQLLVVIAVYLVLMVLLRRPLVCAYMIVSVLFSYYVTIGATEAFFSWLYGGPSLYPGLDWKVPLFLFVILVAVGEDYNVYLATRVYEEQKRHGLFSGLRKAIVRTGGIITSCGVIMAGTFISMTASVWGEVLPAWFPLSGMFRSEVGSLRGIIELGVALTLGVLLDTLIVRPILVPAFMALVAQLQTRRHRLNGPRRHPPHAPHRPRKTAVGMTNDQAPMTNE